MTSNDIHGIEKGWSVKTADGHDVGSVEETTHAYILAKSGLISAERRYFPSATLSHVRPEKGEIGISLTKEEIDGGDWSEAPTELPRTEGTPLNEREDDEVDPIAAATVRDPEHPTSM